MNVTARTNARSITSRLPQPRPEREPSDMAHEMLIRIIKGLTAEYVLSFRDQQVLYHFLFGRDALVVGQRLGIRETTVHKHLHVIYARTRTASRRALIDLGLRQARLHGIPEMRWTPAPVSSPAPAPALAN